MATGLALVCGCNTPSGPEAQGSKPTVLTKLGKHFFAITTKAPAAQQAFDRGLTWAYGFGYHAAEQEFRKAAEADPACAMAYWGIALVNGPHINFPFVPPDRAAKAWEALSRAQDLGAGCTAREKALIRALGHRYAQARSDDRGPLDRAYAEAMQTLWRENPRDPDIGALCAEALMDLHPWDLWSQGQPQVWTGEIVSILETVLRLAPNHPGANHLYIHALEASPDPGKALLSADRLRKMVPDSGHLVHMPSHIYARVGDWPRAAEANRVAMKADLRYREAYPRPGFYALYMAHNTHFLAFTAMMRGRSQEAVELARRLVAEIPEDFLAEYGGVADGFLVFVPEVLMRFGRWEEILSEPAPRGNLPISQALWHFTRAVALTALDRLPEAREERALFEAQADRLPAEASVGNNSAADLMGIARRLLHGEMLAQEGKLEQSIAALEEAVRREDNLRYDEPPDWIQPVRHTLGAVLLRAGRAKEAEVVYRRDLQLWPENGWSLIGLENSLEAQGRHSEALIIKDRRRKAWSGADVAAKCSCYCQAGRAGGSESKN